MHADFAHADASRRIAAGAYACDRVQAIAITTRTTTTTGTGTRWRMRLGVVD